MTKQVRIENADMASFKVRVRTYDKGRDGAADVLVHEQILGHPTAMTDPSRTYLTATRYIVVDELPPEQPVV